MANYYTEAAFTIPCSADQAKQAMAALAHLPSWEPISEVAEAAIAKGDDASLTPEEQIIRHCFTHHPEQAADNTEKELSWDFFAAAMEGAGTTGIFVGTDESICTEHAAVFAQAVLRAFDLPDLIEISAAHTCTKALPDAFGGHGCTVTKDKITWFGLEDFFAQERKAHEAKERYFLCSITEVNGECEYPSRFLMTCSDGECPEKCLDEIFVNYRGEGEKEGDSFVWFEDGLAAKNPNFTEIEPHEFNVMKAHLSVIA